MPFKYFFLFIFLLISIPISSKETSYYFKQISLEEGLSQATVTSILYDSKGFLWIGSKAGLNRYDSYELKVYKNTKSNTNILPHNQILFLAEDALGTVWVSTASGMASYKRSIDNFEVKLYEGKPIRVRSFEYFEGGMFWGGSGVLYKYLYESSSVQKIEFKNGVTIGDHISHIQYWKDSLYLLGTRRDGVWVFDSSTNEVTPASFCKSKDIISIYVDSQKNIWISPYGNGLNCYAEDGEFIGNYNTQNSDLSHDVILDIIEKDHEIWLATDGGGVSLLNLQNNHISVLKYFSNDPTSLPAKSTNCLYLDRNENMWIGTIRSGLIGIKKVFMKTYKDAQQGSEYGLSERTVLALLEDSNGQIWIGTDGEGINRFDPNSSKFTHYPSTYHMKIVSVASFGENQLLLSNFSKGLYTFNKLTGQTKPFTLVNQAVNDSVFKSGHSVNIQAYTSDSIYVYADNIYLYSISKNQFEKINLEGVEYDYSFMQKLSNNRRFSYLVQKQQVLLFDHHTNFIQVICKVKPGMTISSLDEDLHGNLWIGTDKGLLLYEKETSMLVEIESSLITEISSLACDYAGRLWLGVKGSLYAYNIAENRFAIYGDSDGAPTNEYLPKATLLSSDGDIYMGGVMGLLQISKHAPQEEVDKPLLRVSSLAVDGKALVHPGSNQTLRIPWSHSTLSLRVLPLSKDIFRERFFKYFIEQEDRLFNVIETSEKEILLYALPVGIYSIKVSCSMRDGGWTAPEELLSFRVYPPWWRSGWFVVLLSLGILMLFFFWLRYVIHRKESIMELERLEHERAVNEEKVRFLINVSHELRTPLTLIYAPLKRILKQMHSDNKLHSVLESILKQTEHIRDVLNMVLDVRRLEEQGEVMNFASVQLKPWLEAVLSKFKTELDARQIELRVSCRDDLSYVYMDPIKTEIVLSNLIANALKFSPLSSSLSITVLVHSKDVEIRVEDEGIGLSHVDMDNLFNRFYQGEHNYGGSGIGLSYAKQLVEMQGGKIGACNSDKGVGALFWFTIPLAETRLLHKSMGLSDVKLEDIKNDSQFASSSNQTNFSELKVVVAEDSVELGAFIQKSLQEFFKEVVWCRDGVEAYQAIKQHKPDVVVSDIMMPRMNGFELCKKLKSEVEISHIPIILLTACIEKETTDIGYKLGADVYLPKPFDLSVLLAVISNQLTMRTAIKQRVAEAYLVVDPVENTFSNSDEDFMMKLNKIIAQNLSNVDLDVTFLTVEMSMSRSSLYNKFRSIAGLGINDYITNYRIKEAADLLVSTNAPIREIAEQVGYSNQRYFSTVFKEVKGVSPTTYRKQHK